MSVTIIQDVAFQRAFRRVPKDDLPQVLSIRNQIVADAPNLPALVDTLSVEALPDVRYTRHVPLTPWVNEFFPSWVVAGRCSPARERGRDTSFQRRCAAGTWTVTAGSRPTDERRASKTITPPAVAPRAWQGGALGVGH